MRTGASRAPGVVMACALQLALGALLVGLLAACTSGPGGWRPGRSDGGPLETTLTLGRVQGQLSPEASEALAAEVGQVVDAWFEAAYLGGEYPRSDFDDSFPGFTAAAADLARQDREITTNRSIGRRIEGVTATQREVSVDALAVRGKPVGATARFVLAFTTSGDLTRNVVVRGRLLLTPGTDGGWQVFGYDVSSSSPGAGESTGTASSSPSESGAAS